MTLKRIDYRPLILLFALLILVTAAPLFYRDIPMTGHARTSHQDSRYNADTIAAMFDAGYCTPQQDECIDEDTYLSWCSIGDGNAIGLVISTITGKIITGFKGTEKYWSNRCPSTN